MFWEVDIVTVLSLMLGGVCVAVAERSFVSVRSFAFSNYARFHVLELWEQGWPHLRSFCK